MKRALETTEDIERPRKHFESSDNCLQAYFNSNAEILATELPAFANALPEDKYITGKVRMTWPTSNQKVKISITTAFLLDIEISFSGPLSFAIGDSVCISLKGAKLRNVDGAGAKRHPFNLTYDRGAIVKFIASEKRQESFVDTLEPLLDTDSWFLPSSVNSFTTPIHVEEAGLQSAPETPLGMAVPRLESVIRPEVLEPVSPTSKEFGNTDYMRDWSSCHLPSSKPSAAPTDKRSLGRPASLNISQESESEHRHDKATGALEKRNRKEKRMKKVSKRDTRHDFVGQQMKKEEAAKARKLLDAGKGKVSLSVSEHKPVQGSKNHQRRSKAQAARARHRQPSHDPALDLVAGFVSENGEQYRALSALQFHQNNSFVGIVTDAGDVKVTRNGDYSKSFMLVDSSQHQTGITIVTFASQGEKHLLPSATSGQALLFRNVLINKWNGKAQGVGHKHKFSWCGYDPSLGKQFHSVPEGVGQSTWHTTSHKLSPSELDYFVHLSEWWRAITEATKTRNENSENTIFLNAKLVGRRPRVTISEMKPNVFVDCVAKLLHVADSGASFVTAYVTDYTENLLLEQYQHPSEFPLGRRTLKIALWETTKEVVDDLEIGAFYLFENIRPKEVIEHLEGNMGWQGWPSLTKISITSGQELIADILRRQQHYEENINASKLPSDSTDIQSNEPISGHLFQEQAGRKEDMGENMNERLDKNQGDTQKEDMQAQPDFAAASIHDKLNAEQSSTNHDRFLECSHINQKCSTVQQVCRSLKCPNKFLLRCRIVEYYPLNIEDFIRAKCSECNEEINLSKYDLCPSCGTDDRTVKKYYQFVLRVTDESTELLNVTVHGKEADTLLNISAADARDNIATLKARLFPLIGHLYPWHETLDVAEKKEGPLVNLSVLSWKIDSEKEKRLYNLFDCYLLSTDVQ